VQRISRASLRSGLPALSTVSDQLRSIPTSTGPERPVLLAVDQELGEGATLRVAPELADPVGSLEVGEHQDVEKLGAGSGAEGVEALSEPALEFIGSHGRRLRPPTVGRVPCCA
jgi:hypothetical protein